MADMALTVQGWIRSLRAYPARLTAATLILAIGVGCGSLSRVSKRNSSIEAPVNAIFAALTVGVTLGFLTRRFQSEDATGINSFSPLTKYEPHAPETVELFKAAAQKVGLPQSWARQNGLHEILRKESNGYVGILNYDLSNKLNVSNKFSNVPDTVNVLSRLRAGGDYADSHGVRSHATGLGQLQPSNVDRFYPSGRLGIGVPVEEAAGMMRYIEEMYGNPDNAWRVYQLRVCRPAEPRPTWYGDWETALELGCKRGEGY